ncbi:M14 family metallopeptidase [Fulvivirga lutea]|uniref:M14 family metallopeptidase n=1 Tax=Fulvivirga lutea TaxID=2810512 RepID=A0A974WHE8_9BACT|nr:M14 family metallopeptidase [Fulvivirga lutea]QSE98160.1 M14 family metallopeptidase [Fulvivirga lutea]
MNRILAFLFVLISYYGIGQSPATVFESSGGTSTATYDGVINYYKALANQYPEIEIKEMGLTDSGLPLHLVTLDTRKEFDYKKAYADGRAIVLINNGIHPGEPDGIEACQMLLRNYIQDSEKKSLLNDVIIGVIPVYNIGGALDRNSFSRVNQDGPLEYGFRGNARNYDLNRDFIKADTRNTKAFYEIFHYVNPDIFIDTHVSNGADYQYTITHLITQHNKMGGTLGQYLEENLRVKLEQKMKDKGAEITPYVNVFNTTPDNGFPQFLDNPRYSTGYTTLFNTVGLMIETHMLKPFKTRVESSYTFLETVLEMAYVDGKRIRELKEKRQNDIKPGSKLAIDWRLTRGESAKLNFKGYEGETRKSEVTDLDRLYYNHEKPFTKSIPYYNTYVASEEVVIPKAYVIPQGWHDVIELLKLNKAKYRQLKQDSSINVEVYTIEKFTTSKTVYEGHYMNNNVQVSVSEEEVKFRKGDYIFFTDHTSGRYLVETLEPKAIDSFFSWNFFDTILQQKEGFSPYVFEDLALQLIESEPQLKKDFKQKKRDEPDFALNWFAQLDYIYKNSPYYEEAHMRYPVYRLVK